MLKHNLQETVPVAFLFDVDNTLLDNDHVIDDFRRHVRAAFHPERATQYWDIFEGLRNERGYADYLGAIQQYRFEHPLDPHFVKLSLYLIDYPFADRLYPESLEVIQHVGAWGPVVVVSDGDAVFQPRKVERSGLMKAVDGRVLIYIHKERDLPDVESHYPAEHYVLIDDKPRILAAAKKEWQDRITTVFVRQGQYAHDQKEVAKYPTPDVTLERIGDLLNWNTIPQCRVTDTDFVEVYRAANAIDAHLLKASLEAAGISTQITDESVATMVGPLLRGLPNLWWAAPRVLVAKINAAKAAVILRAIQEARETRSSSGNAG